MGLERANSMRASRAPWKRLISGSTAAVGLAEPAFATALPGAGVLDTGGFRCARLIFAGTDTAVQAINYQVVGWQQYKRGNTRFWMSRLLAKGVATLGTKVVGAAGADIEGAGSLLADTLTDTIGLAGSIAHSPADNTMAFLEVDTVNCDFIEVEIDRNTAVTADVICQLCDGIW